jgi:hypothetical protein
MAGRVPYMLLNDPRNGRAVKVYSDEIRSVS